MRTGHWSLIGLIGVLAFAQSDKSQVPVKRYGIEADVKSYPQTTPKDTLASLIKAVDSKRVDYVLAQLAESEWLDRRVKETSGGFAALVEESRVRFADDPAAVKRLKKLLADGEWKTEESAAFVRQKDAADMMFFRKVGGRWFVENRKK